MPKTERPPTPLRYGGARDDTREALRQARLDDGITPFYITIDRDSEAELRDLYGEVGYTIIDDVLSLARTHARDLPEADDVSARLAPVALRRTNRFILAAP